MITFEELKKKIEDLGYIATDELLYDTFNALCMFHGGEVDPGQDIFAICLEGPPGAGKTEFAKTYTKVCNEIFGNVLMVDYQCDATTGKTELFEDINISAAIRGDADNVNIPGKLVEAIKKVNEGNKVILFIDEYDKAREETDAFLLQFLQSGKINSTQHGDLEIKPEFKTNLQVILCKNDMREELSGPLSRRIRITRLKDMEPTIFYQVAHRVLIDNRKDAVSDGLLNLVTLMYQKAYANKELYNRLPSCSEMLIALEDADRLLKKANAPQYIIYNTIVRSMFKSVDDINTFERSLEKMANQDESKLVALIKFMKIQEPTEEKVDLNSLIAQNVLADESKKLREKIKEFEDLIAEYQQKFAQMEENRRKVIGEEIEKIMLERGELVSTKLPEPISCFDDEADRVKRGYNIFDIGNDWTNIATFTINNLSHHYLIETLIKHADELDIKVYENGILIKDDSGLKVIVVATAEDSRITYRFMANSMVIPSTYLEDVKTFMEFVRDTYQNQPKNAKMITNDVIEESSGSYVIDAVVYDDKDIKKQTDENHDNKLDFVVVTELSPNVYSVSCHGNDVSLPFTCECADSSKAIVAADEIKTEKRKSFTNE